MGPSLGSGSRLELNFRLEVNKDKARARSSLNSKSSNELFCRLEEARRGSKAQKGLFFNSMKTSIDEFILKWDYYHAFFK